MKALNLNLGSVGSILGLCTSNIDGWALLMSELRKLLDAFDMMPLRGSTCYDLSSMITEISFCGLRSTPSVPEVTVPSGRVGVTLEVLEILFPGELPCLTKSFLLKETV
jgi:hypothetical protein